MGRVSDARERLVQAAIDLIWSDSYGGVSVDALCERAGVKKGSFYHFFASKDDLVIAALEANWDARRPVLEQQFTPERKPLDRLMAYLTHVYERQRDLKRKYGRVVGCFHGCVGTECIRQNPAIEAKVKQILGEYLRYYEVALKEAQAEGTVRVSDPRDTARALFALMEGVLAQARIANDVELVKSLPRHAAGFLGIE